MKHHSISHLGKKFQVQFLNMSLSGGPFYVLSFILKKKNVVRCHFLNVGVFFSWSVKPEEII